MSWLAVGLEPQPFQEIALQDLFVAVCLENSCVDSTGPLQFGQHVGRMARPLQTFCLRFGHAISGSILGAVDKSCSFR